MGPFSFFTVFVGVISCFWCGRQNYSFLVFSVHGKIGNFIIIIGCQKRLYHFGDAEQSDFDCCVLLPERDYVRVFAVAIPSVVCLSVTY